MDVHWAIIHPYPGCGHKTDSRTADMNGNVYKYIQFEKQIVNDNRKQ